MQDVLDLGVGASSTSSEDWKHLLARVAALESQVRQLAPALDAKLATMRREAATAIQTLDMKSARALRNQRHAPTE